jgi:hypothetical protein
MFHPSDKVRWIGQWTSYTHVDMKFANEAQAEAPELKPKPMSAISPLHEWNQKEEKRSYRPPDLVCNGT